MSDPTIVEQRAEARADAHEATDAPAPEETGLRFDDPYWDDAFCAWWDPSLGTCC